MLLLLLILREAARQAQIASDNAVESVKKANSLAMDYMADQVIVSKSVFSRGLSDGQDTQSFEEPLRLAQESADKAVFYASEALRAANIALTHYENVKCTVDDMTATSSPVNLAEGGLWGTEANSDKTDIATCSIL